MKIKRLFAVPLVGMAAAGLLSCGSTDEKSSAPQQFAEPVEEVYEISLMKDTIKFMITKRAYDLLKTAETLRGLNDPSYQIPSEDKRVVYLLTIDRDADNRISLEEANAAVNRERVRAIKQFGDEPDLDANPSETIKRK